MKNIAIRWLALTLLLIIAAFLCTCSQETRKSFSELFELRNEIAAQYQVQDVGVKLVNNKILIVSLINSQFSSLSEIDQKAKAKEIATWVKQKFTRSDTLTSIAVQFTSRKQVLIFSSNINRQYSFTIDELTNASVSQ